MTKGAVVLPGTRERGRAIRDHIVAHVRAHPDDIAQTCADHFGISRQAVNKHLGRLVANGILRAHGVTRNRRYSLHESARKDIVVPLAGGAKEDVVWRTEIEPFLADLPKNTQDIWNYGFTEMLNNAIDHSSGTMARIVVARTAADMSVTLKDDGEGIFRKIARELRLDDERHAVLELAKGKLTTDPEKHSGEGIFFTSRLFDEFKIFSYRVYFSHDSRTEDDWISEAQSSGFPGTCVLFELNNHTTKTLKQIFDEYAEDFAFSKTIVPVRLVQYGDEALVSRSQAKRLLTNFDRFKTVILDFDGVDQIGQGFADEVFRVFVRSHPNIELSYMNANQQVASMILRARETS